MLSEDEDEEMPERTLSQVTNEIEQAAKKVSSAQLSLKNAQDELRTLIGERNQIEVQLLAGTGVAPSTLQSTRDGLPVAPATRRTRKVSTKTAKDGASEAQVRQWLKENGHEKLNPGRLAENYWNIYNNAHLA